MGAAADCLRRIVEYAAPVTVHAERRRAMVQIKTPEQIAKMREAGLVVAAIHAATREAAVPGATTQDLDQVARKVIADHGAKSNFLGYGGFPATICTSVNEVVVHGIPDDKTVLKDGDIISIDSRRDHRRLARRRRVHGLRRHRSRSGGRRAVPGDRGVDVVGIAAMKVNNRLVDISKAIESYIRRQPRPSTGKYGIVEDYGGHGIGTEMHMDPHLLNYVARKRGKGIKLVPGVCLAIEPMVSSARHAPRCSPTSGPSSRPTAAGPPTGSTPSPSRSRARWCSPHRTAAARSWRSTAWRRRRTRWAE